VQVVKLEEPVDEPWDLDRASPVYQFEFFNKAAYDDGKPFYIQLSYDEGAGNGYKQVYFFDKGKNAWRSLPTTDFPNGKFVRSLIHLPYARIAVFSNPRIMSVGKASWYAYKGGDFAASPDFPKGSVVRVYALNPEKGKAKFVDVTINDYGPNRRLHPDRVIDLDKVAFSKIDFLSDGTTDVYLELVSLPKGSESPFADRPASSEPLILSRAAILVADNGSTIALEKNATSTLPLASLTKMVAVSVFLENQTDLSKTVAYSVKDEEYNYEYCEKRESARLALSDGETLTFKDLIYSALVGSANNAVETLARASGLLRPDFIARMNALAAEWGAASTVFYEPTGLSPENMTTARDYAIILNEALKNSVIASASSAATYSFKTLNTKKSHTLRNTNHLVSNFDLEITGTKTGYLEEAGYCLAAKTGDGLIAVVLGADTRDRSFREVEDLIWYGRAKAAEVKISNND